MLLGSPYVQVYYRFPYLYRLSCRAQADLYGIASERPNDWIVDGRVRLLDFLRAYELYSTG